MSEKNVSISVPSGTIVNGHPIEKWKELHERIAELEIEAGAFQTFKEMRESLADPPKPSIPLSKDDLSLHAECDRCNYNQSDGGDIPEDTLRYLGRLGWCKRGYRVLCPKCAKDTKKE